MTDGNKYKKNTTNCSLSNSFPSIYFKNPSKIYLHQIKPSSNGMESSNTRIQRYK